MESRKMILMNLFEGKGRKGNANVENGLVDTVGEGESEMNGESNINIYTLFIGYKMGSWWEVSV